MYSLFILYAKRWFIPVDIAFFSESVLLARVGVASPIGISVEEDRVSAADFDEDRVLCSALVAMILDPSVAPDDVFWTFVMLKLLGALSKALVVVVVDELIALTLVELYIVEPI